MLLKCTVSEMQGVKVHNDIIMFQRNFFGFFGQILTYIMLELQFNAWQSFLRNHGLDIFGFRDTGG